MFKTLSKVLLYENIFTNHDSDSLDCNGHPSPILCNHLHSAEGFLKKFVQQTAYKMSPNSYGITGTHVSSKTGMTGPPSSPSPEINTYKPYKKWTVQVIYIMSTWSHRGNQNRGLFFPQVTKSTDGNVIVICYGCGGPDSIHLESAVQLYKSTKLRSTVPGEVPVYRPVYCPF